MNAYYADQASKDCYVYQESLSSLTNSDTPIATPYYPQCYSGKFEISPVPTSVKYDYTQAFVSGLEYNQFTSPLLDQYPNYSACHHIYDNVISKQQPPIANSDVFDSTNQIFNQWPVENISYQQIYQRHESLASPNFQPIEDQGVNSPNECYKQKMYDQDQAYSSQVNEFNKVPSNTTANCSSIPKLWNVDYTNGTDYISNTHTIKGVPHILKSTPNSQIEGCLVEQPTIVNNFNYSIQSAHSTPYPVSTPIKPPVKEFKCDKCEKTFHRKSSFKVHAITHSGLKPYKCTYPGCAKKFSVLSNQRRHLRLHRKKLMEIQEISNRDSLQIDIFRQYMSGHHIEFLANDPSLINTNYLRTVNQYQKPAYYPSQSRPANVSF